jgi:urea transport system ATP-binding protein
MLKIEKLNQHYGSSHTLRDVSFDVPVGQCTALLGRNGVGKTTLLKCLMGVVPVTGGSIAFDGREITALSPFVRVRLGLGYVPQGREIFPRLTVEENLLMGLASRRGGKPSDIPGDVFEMFPVLKTMLRRRGGDLSGGQQQQLAIARALVMKPKVLILDEPTEGIQPSIIKEIERVIHALSERGDMAILLVEQYFEFARELADQFVILRRGEIVKRGVSADMNADGLRSYLIV